jgi:sigma-B regulation protein RsbQ
MGSPLKIEKRDETSFICDNRRVHFIDEGSGQPILFVHGLGGNSNNWLKQKIGLSPSRRVIAIDLPGHGRSDGITVPFVGYCDVLAALCDHLGIKAVDIVGLSKGARVALMAAVRRPELVRSVIAVNTFVSLTPEDAESRRKLYDLLLLPGGAQMWADKLLQQMGVSENQPISRGFHRSLSSLNPRHIWERFQELLAFDQDQELPLVKCPVLLVRGDRDDFVPAYCADHLQENLPDASIIVMKSCGHLPYLEAPDAFNKIVLEFTERTTSPLRV